MIRITVEELDIVVQASVEGALKEFQKLVPGIKQATKKMIEQINKSDFSGFAGKIQQAIKQVKQKLESFKSSNKANNLEVKVTTEDAKKQITQLQKQIDSLQAKINARQMKLDVITPQLDRITEQTVKSITPDGVSSDNPSIQRTINNSLSSNKDYTKLSTQESKLTSEISAYNRQLSEAKAKMSQLNQEINQTATSQNKLTSFFSMFKNKISEAKTQSNGLKSSFNQIPKLTQNITNNIKNMGSGIKQGLGHVLKYASALFSLRGIYSILSSSAQSWLSSQNAGAKQLSTNIEYMKYAMGSALAPVIQFVTNLVYQLMKAIQSVAYALTGVNIFAKATASNYSSMAKGAKKAKDETKQLAGIHNEINNISDSKNGDSGSGGAGTPSFDLSQMNPSNSILDAIKNGDWYQVGATIGQKLNEAMDSIPWDKIQDGARKIGTNIAQFLNGFIATTNWTQVGNTFAQGLNTIIYFGYSFISTFDWKQFGKAISDSINGFFNNVDWATAGKTLGDGIKGVLSTISTTLQEIDWAGIGQDIVTFLVNIDWGGVISGLCSSFGAALGGISATIASLLLEAIIYPMANFFSEKTEECGGNVILGLLKGIVDGLIGIGEWIYNNMIYPFVKAFCNALGIHSPSTVFAEFGQNIIQGLFNGIQSLVNTIAEIWNNLKQTAVNVFNSIKDTVINIWNNVVNTTSNIWNTIKTKVKEGAQGAWNGITSIFGNVANWFRDQFSRAWQAVKNVFSTGGAIFDGIKDGILNGLKSIVNAIIGGINKVISIPFNGLNSALRAIKNVDIMGLKPFNWIGTISVPQIPKLAKGGVLYDETLVMAGEYSGAKSNPEIVTPQNIMYDTMRRALEDTEFHNNNDGQSIYLTVNVGNKKLGQILLENLRDKKRQTGKDIEALVGG